MGILSSIPKGIVIAMQVALAALVVMAAVPIAAGGIDVENLETNLDYVDDEFLVRVSISAALKTSLFFDITGFGYSVSFTSGSETLPVFNSENVTIPRNGTAEIDERADIPLTTLIMMMLLGASSGHPGVDVNLAVRGSTLGGMISASADVSVMAISITDVLKTMVPHGTDDMDSLYMEFNIHTLPGDIFPPSGLDITVTIGGTVCTFKVTSSGDVTVTWNSSGDGIINDIMTNTTDIGISITYNGNSSELTKGQADLIVDVLTIIHGRMVP